MKRLLVLPAVILLASCASIIEGSTQTLNVSTSPSYASKCTLKGSDYTREFSAPGTVDVPKSKYPVVITCTPENGSAAGTAKVLSDIGAWGYGGAVAGVGVGAVVDSATGASNKYPDNITIPLGRSDTRIGETPYNSNADFNK